jgi:hypothetical protein
MNRQATIDTKLICCMLLLLASACIRPLNENTTPTMTHDSSPPTSTPLSTPPTNTPLWSEHSIDSIAKYRNSFSSTAVRPQPPPFYKGPMPLKYRTTFAPSPFIYDERTVKRIEIKHEFGDWTTIFIYTEDSLGASGIASGARSFDKSNNLLAEARFEKITAPGMGIILEVYYDPNGSVRFWCKSQIEFLDGTKIKELEAHGNKVRDYYFIWPVSAY